MAGLGSRFSQVGYKLPKPLIPVMGKPMILKAVDMMPKANKWIFIVRKEHVKIYKIDMIIKKHIPNSQIIAIDYTTEGQLSTCLLAREYLKGNQELFIGACDNGYLWNKPKFNQLRKKTDVIPWVFTKQNNLTNNPTAWGWVKIDGKGNVLGVSVKKPISDDPFNDYAIIGSFYFRKSSIFLKIADKIIADNTRVNNEFYVDTAINYAPKMGYKTKIFNSIIAF